MSEKIADLVALKAAAEMWKRKVDYVDLEIGRCYFREFSGADILAFQRAQQDAAAAPYYAVALGWCDADGNAMLCTTMDGRVNVDDEAITFLQSDKVPGELLAKMINKAMEMSGISSLGEEVEDAEGK